ncbi:hypothetical protein NpNSSI1_00010649 [Neofusicoccum parvum]|uniref:Uncharacterized protein n=1 Tax=Neofusicoccum parvum TaxID=310453 RepID=A0ACB5S3Q4_9PEZI|nr:hypothetical protein NpPPO83_00004051 [Neofusicoccum parvum]GME40420.1 hypothetical protein NpNSSI1_00010649 [Neofusicoccum parvum]
MPNVTDSSFGSSATAAGTGGDDGDRKRTRPSDDRIKSRWIDQQHAIMDRDDEIERLREQLAETVRESEVPQQQEREPEVPRQQQQLAQIERELDALEQ